MPKETKIPIEIDKENIVTVPKEIMKPIKTVQQHLSQGKGWHQLRQRRPNKWWYQFIFNYDYIMIVQIGTINSRPCLKKWWYKLGK